MLVPPTADEMNRSTGNFEGALSGIMGGHLMHLFDRIDPLLIERRSAQLWALAIASIAILSTGIALLAYPSAFSEPVYISGPAMRRLFFGFCVLSALLVGYLTDRQMALQELRRRLLAEQSRNSTLLLQASVDLLGILPNFGHFQDRLSMEFRRATIGVQPLSFIVVSLVSAGVLDKNGLATAYGDAVKCIIRRLRTEDSVYCLRDGVFSAILPGASSADANRVAGRLENGIREVAGAPPAFTFDLRVINYPNDARSAHEIENLVKAAFSERPLLMARAA